MVNDSVKTRYRAHIQTGKTLLAYVRHWWRIWRRKFPPWKERFEIANFHLGLPLLPSRIATVFLGERLTFDLSHENKAGYTSILPARTFPPCIGAMWKHTRYVCRRLAWNGNGKRLNWTEDTGDPARRERNLVAGISGVGSKEMIFLLYRHRRAGLLSKIIQATLSKIILITVKHEYLVFLIHISL